MTAKLMNLAHEINHHKHKESMSEFAGIMVDNDESTRLVPASLEEKLNMENMNRKRTLIYEELEKISTYMKEYNSQAKKLSRWDNVTKSVVTACSAAASLILFIGIDQRKSGDQVNPALYYTATGCTCIATVLGQLTNSWNLGEKSHNNNTTYRSLHNLHDFISYQLVRNHITSPQLDALLSDMSSRLILIRDSASNGGV